MPPVSIRNRIAALLLDSDEPLDAAKLHELWTTKRKPTMKTISNLLASHSEFVRMSWWKENHGRKQNKYTHIDHSLLSPEEEE